MTLCFITLSVSANSKDDLLYVTKIKEGQAIPKSASIKVLSAKIKKNRLILSVKYRGSRDDSIKIYWNGLYILTEPGQVDWHLVRHSKSTSKQLIKRKLVFNVKRSDDDEGYINLLLNDKLVKRFDLSDD